MADLLESNDHAIALKTVLLYVSNSGWFDNSESETQYRKARDNSLFYTEESVDPIQYISAQQKLEEAELLLRQTSKEFMEQMLMSCTAYITEAKNLRLKHERVKRLISDIASVSHEGEHILALLEQPRMGDGCLCVSMSQQRSVVAFFDTMFGMLNKMGKTLEDIQFFKESQFHALREQMVKKLESMKTLLAQFNSSVTCLENFCNSLSSLDVSASTVQHI